MKICSWNVNGIRAAYQNGLKDFLETQKPDILCLQEIKATEDQFPLEISTGSLFSPSDYHLYVNSAQKLGYAGVAVLTKEKPVSVNTKLGHERFDSEGRMLELEFKNFTLINLYIPHGGRLKENLGYKLEVYELVLKKFAAIKSKKVILCGDFNIAHTELDLENPKSNKNNIMFTPEERMQIDRIIELGFVDSLRCFHSEGGLYSWWPYAFNARERNLGWRIDYIFVSKPLSPNLKDAFVAPETKGSDHGPVGVELD